MITPEHAFRLFVYADWAMLLLGLTSLTASIGWCLVAMLPRSKGRRGAALLRAVVALLLFGMIWATQASVLIPHFNQQLDSPLTVLFALPLVLMAFGLIGSVAYGAHAALRRHGDQRRRTMLRSLLGIIVSGIGIAPHAITALTPVLCSQAHSRRPGTLAQIGTPVPDFHAVCLDGTRFSTADLPGKVVVLNFFATWCGPCNMELPHLQAMWTEFRGDDDFRMLAIGREESTVILEAFRNEHGYTLPMAADNDASVYRRFASEAIPRTYLISREGIILYEWTGAYDEEIPKLRKLIRGELAREE